MTAVREPKTITKPWEIGEPTATIQRILRRVDAVPAVLLVSGDPAALVPVHLALEAHSRVMTFSAAKAFEARLVVQVLVLHAPARTASPSLFDLPARFPGAAMLWVAEGPSDRPLVPHHLGDSHSAATSSVPGPHGRSPAYGEQL